MFRIHFASLHTGEASRNVIDHCLQTFTAMRLAKIIKTENGPAYIGNNLTQFCKKFGNNLEMYIAKFNGKGTHLQYLHKNYLC